MTTLLRSVPFAIRLDEVLGGQPGVPTENQLLRIGSFEYEGQSLSITTSMLASMVKNFDDKVRGIDLAVDYSHESDDVAAGWIRKLYLMNEGTELWISVTWTANGKVKLAEKEYRYLSADFVLNYINNETKMEFGPTLFGAGLTNRPFIKGMEPVVALTETKTLKGNQMDPKDKQIADLTAQVEALKKKIEEDVQSDAAGTEGDKDMAEMKKKMSDMEKTCADLQAKNDKLSKDANAAADDKQLAEKKSSFDKMMLDGKVCEAQREHYMKNDMVKFSENAGKPNLKSSGSATDAPATAGSSEEAQDQVIKLAEKKLKDKEVKTLSEGMTAVLKENSDLRTKIYGK